MELAILAWVWRQLRKLPPLFAGVSSMPRWTWYQSAEDTGAWTQDFRTPCLAKCLESAALCAADWSPPLVVPVSSHPSFPRSFWPWLVLKTCTHPLPVTPEPEVTWPWPCTTLWQRPPASSPLSCGLLLTSPPLLRRSIPTSCRRKGLSTSTFSIHLPVLFLFFFK